MPDEKFKIVNKSMTDFKDTGIKVGELSLINQFTRRDLKEDEVYVFSVVLCDNDVDRQNERFTDDALVKLSTLFVGKTGIMDHDVVSDNQTARIFSCEVQTDSEKLNCTGNVYKRLVGRAYMPKSEKNQDFILLIDSGIKKEVSINCSVESMRCSICGSNIKTGHCNHIKGREYKKDKITQVCHYVLDNPVDAYEWSFVVVPAQREAGVIKSFVSKSDGGEFKMGKIIKHLGNGNEIKLDSHQSQELSNIIKSLEERARVGDAYFEELKNEVVRLSAIAQPEIDMNVMKSLVNKMSIGELRSFKDSYKKKVFADTCIKPQLSSGNIVEKPQNKQFKI